MLTASAQSLRSAHHPHPKPIFFTTQFQLPRYSSNICLAEDRCNTILCFHPLSCGETCSCKSSMETGSPSTARKRERIESSFVICCGVGDQPCCRCYFWSPPKGLNSHRQQRQQITRGHHLDQSDQRQESHDRFTSAILRTLMMMAVDLERRSEV